MQEVIKGIKIKEKDKNNLTTNLSVNLKQYFNLSKEEESDFNNAINSNKGIKDKNLQLVSQYFQLI